MKVTGEFHCPIILHKQTPRSWQKVVTSCSRHDASACKSPSKIGTPPNVSTTGACGRAWLQMDYFQELRVNELLVNHATSAKRENTAGQVTVLFILLCSFYVWKITEKNPFFINEIGTIVPVFYVKKKIVPVCSKNKKLLISSNAIQISKKFGLLDTKLDIPLHH